MGPYVGTAVAATLPLVIVAAIVVTVALTD